MFYPPFNVKKLCAGALGAAVMMGTASAAPDKGTEGMVKRQDFEIVDCLLPGEVRSLGGATFLSRRRPIRTTASDCHIRGGEYTAYDRADYKSALRVWMDLASSGDAAAQNNVGEIFERGLGGEPHYATAVIWYQKVIENKSASEPIRSRALFNMATLYEQGLGVDKDPLLALNYYRRASGLPEDSLIYTSAKDREVDALRGALEKSIADKNAQIELMNKQLIELHLSDPYVVQEVRGEGSQLLRCLDEPLQHGIGINLEHPCCASDAQPFGSSRHYAHNEFDRCALAMKQRAEGLQKVTATGDAQPLPPLAPTGMAVGAQIPQSHPAPIRTIRMRTAMMRGIHLAFSATCGGNPWGWSSRRRARGGLQSLIGIESCFQ